MRVLTLCVLGIALAGCDAAAPEVGDLALRPSRAEFAAGTEVEAVVSNESAHTLYLYDCGGRILLNVQRQTGADWENVGFVNNDCATVYILPYRLDAGDRQQVSFIVRSPGTYRLQTPFGTAPGPGTDVGRADWVDAVSETFVVTAP